MVTVVLFAEVVLSVLFETVSIMGRVVGTVLNDINLKSPLV